MLHTIESDSLIGDSGENNSLKTIGFSQVCIEICARYNIEKSDVVNTLNEVYSNVTDRQKRKGNKVNIEDINCDVVFRKPKSSRSEDVLLVFGPQQLVVLDVVPFIRINPKNGEKTSTAVLRICPGSFGKFSDKYPKSIKEKVSATREAVARVDEYMVHEKDGELTSDKTEG